MFVLSGVLQFRPVTPLVVQVCLFISFFIPRRLTDMACLFFKDDQQMDEDGSFLDGVIDLSVLLPDGRQVRMPIDGR